MLEEVMKKRIIIISSIIILSIVIVGLYSTFATEEAGVSNNTSEFVLSENNSEITVPASSSKTVIYKVTNTNRGKVKYGVSYLGENISVKVYEDSSDEITGYIDYGETKFIKLYIENTSNSDGTVSIKTVQGYENGGELEGTNVIPSGYVLVSEVYVPVGKVTLVEHLTNKYMSANPSKVSVANNGINYYCAESVGMMNDGMGSNHTWEDGENTGNIRYYGSAPSNYIDIGDRDSDGNVILWRIIGVFKNIKLADGSTDTLVKVIRDETIGTMFWNEDVNNDWSSATLQTYLNKGEYYTGLLQSVKDNIASVEWSLLGNTDEIIYSNDMYGYERGSLTSEDYGYIYDSSWYGKIALMYPSDYSYATDLTKCSKKLIDYGTDINCTEKNWLYKNNYQWLITPHASDSTYPHAWITFNEGGLGEGVVHLIEDSHVYPSLYLKSNLIYDTGDGSSVENAYVVK